MATGTSTFLELPTELRKIVYNHLLSGFACDPIRSCRHIRLKDHIHRCSIESTRDHCSPEPAGQKPVEPSAFGPTTLLYVNRAIHHEYESSLWQKHTFHLSPSLRPASPNEGVQSIRIDISSPGLHVHGGDKPARPTLDSCPTCLFRRTWGIDSADIETNPVYAVRSSFPCLKKLQIICYPFGAGWDISGNVLAIVITISRNGSLAALEGPATGSWSGKRDRGIAAVKSYKRQFNDVVRPGLTDHRPAIFVMNTAFEPSKVAEDWYGVVSEHFKEDWILEDVAWKGFSLGADGSSSFESDRPNVPKLREILSLGSEAEVGVDWDSPPRF